MKRNRRLREVRPEYLGSVLTSTVPLSNPERKNLWRKKRENTPEARKSSARGFLVEVMSDAGGFAAAIGVGLAYLVLFAAITGVGI